MNYPEKLLDFAATILAEVEPLSQAQLHSKPSPDAWSVMDVLCHIEEFIPFWTTQTHNIAHGRGADWGRTHSDPARLAAVHDTTARNLPDVAANIHARAQAAAQSISLFTDAELAVEAASKNPRWGTRPARFVVEHLLVEHLEKHLGQIRRNLAQHPGA